MKVLHVVPGLAARTGGVAAAVVDHCLGLEALGVETVIVTTDLPGTALSKRPRAVRPDELPEGAGELDVRLCRARRPHRLAWSPALAREVARETRHADVVHIHSLFLLPQLAAYRAARRAAVPYVVTPHGMLDPYLRRQGRLPKLVVGRLWQDALLERASVLHVTAAAEAELIADIAPSVPRRIVPNSIDWASFQHLPDGEAFRRDRLAGHRGPVVMNVGRISRKKGLDILIRAFAIAARETPGALLAVVGPDDEGHTPSLAALAEREGVGGRVVFTGPVYGAERVAALAAADVWALPSHAENFGLAVVEALAAGAAVVVSPAVNIAPDAERAGAAVVAPLSGEGFGRAIRDLLGDVPRREELGRRGAAFARRYDRADVAGQLAAVYSEVVSARPLAATLEVAHA